MTDLRFPILGSVVPAMVGRAAIMDRVWRALTKPSPSHLSIVGPRHAGKTVFLHALAARARDAAAPYSVTMIWDLAHLTPTSDEEFFAGLSKRMAAELRRVEGSTFSTYADHIEGGLYAELREALEALDGEGASILLLLDGLDRPLAADTLTRNLWDQLRELASLPSLRIVTGSRARLRELIRSAATATSDFWGIFDPNPVLLGPLDDADVREAIARCELGPPGPGAEAELRNWSGCFPPLLLGLLNAVDADGHGAAALTPDRVNAAASSALTSLQDVLADMWEICPEATKDAYRELADIRQRPTDVVGREHRERLVSLGMAREDAARLHAGCRLLERFVAERRADEGSVARLFRLPDGYGKHIGSVLSLRLNQIVPLNRELRRAVDRSIGDLPDFPGQALTNLRNLAERSFALVWAAEFGPEKKIPAHVFGHWRERGVRRIEDFERLDVPGEIRRQARLLQLYVGAEQNVNRQARYVSRQTFQLLDAVVGFGNYGQHTEGEEVGLGTAVAAVIVALELSARLAAELPAPA